MKKILALVLALCMMAAAVPVFAETAEETTGSNLESLFADILGGDGSIEEKAAGLIEKISELKENFTGSDNQFSAIVSSLTEKLQGLIQPGEGALGDLLSGLKDQLAGIGNIDLNSILSGIFGGGEGEGANFDLGGLLGGLLGGGEGGESIDLGGLLGGLLGSGGEEGDYGWTEEDQAELDQRIAQLNIEAEAETGESVPNRKNAESVEEFYGSWNEKSMVYDGQTYDMSEYGEGIFIGENTYYVTENGEKADGFPHPETAELTIRDGVLKVLSEDGFWSTFVLTEDGDLVSVDSIMMIYYTRAEE